MNIQIEEIKNLVINPSFEGLTMHRINFNGKRGYVQKDPFRVYSGLTGALSAATFKGNQDNKRLEKWRDTMVSELGSQEKQEAYLNSMASFGTHLHEALVKIKINGKLNWKEEREEAFDFFMTSAKKHGIIPSLNVIEKQVYEYCKQAASLMQFCFEQVEEIVAIETMAKCDILGIATPIDMVVKLRTKQGTTMASLNIKTSTSVGDHQLEQTAMEKYLWNKTYPDFQVEKTGVYRGKDWRENKGIPTYELVLLDAIEEKEMTEDTIARLKQCKKSPKSNYDNFPSTVAVFEGETKAGEKPNIIYKPMEQVFLESMGI